jgi:hypothetical protein
MGEIDKIANPAVTSQKGFSVTPLIVTIPKYMRSPKTPSIVPKNQVANFVPESFIPHL